MNQRILGDWALLGSAPNTFVSLRVFHRDGHLVGLFTVSAPQTPAYVRDLMADLWDTNYHGAQVVLILNGPAYAAPVDSLDVLGTETGGLLSVNYIMGRLPLIVHQSVPGLEDSDAVLVDWGNISGTLSNQTDLQAALDGKVNTSRAINAGTGLTGGGNLSGDRTISAVFGTLAGTVCEGSDARLSNARTPTAHATTHKSGGSDPIKLDELGATTDITTLDASVTAHGLLPKLSGSASQFLNGLGAWIAAVLPSRAINAGTGLTGGGDLSTDRTISAVLGTTAGTVCEGNDSRLSNARTPTAHAVTHKAEGTDSIKLDEFAAPTDVTTLDASTLAHGLLPKLSGSATQFLNGLGAWIAAVLPSRAVNTGTGLTGGGDLSADRTISAVFGTTAGTICEGSDSRVTGAVPQTRLINTGTSLSGGGNLGADLTLDAIQDIRTTALPTFAAVKTVLLRPNSNADALVRGRDRGDDGVIGGAGSSLTVRGGDTSGPLSTTGGSLTLRGGAGPVAAGTVKITRTDGATLTLQCNNVGAGFFGATPVGKQGVYTITAAPAVSTTLNADGNGGSDYVGIATQAGTPFAAVVDLNDLRNDVVSLAAVLRQVIKHLGDTSGLGLLDETSF